MRRSAGFTLIELLIAMAIVAIIGAIGLTGLRQVILQQEIARERSERWRNVQLAVRMIAQDLAQVHPRPVRDELGSSYQPTVLASPNAQFALEMTRGGWANPAGFRRGTVMRVAYDFEQDTLVRYHWPVLDRLLSTPPLRHELLQGVTNVEIRFLDAAGEWHVEWPPLDVQDARRLILRPRAIEIALELEEFGRVWRLVETNG
jgi:general secretion pathway protein J